MAHLIGQAILECEYNVVGASVAKVDQTIPRVARTLAVHPRAEGEAEAAADHLRARESREEGVARAGKGEAPINRAGWRWWWRQVKEEAKSSSRDDARHDAARRN